MECLVAPVSALKRRCSGRYGYRQLVKDEEIGFGSSEDLVTVVVGKEKREFRVDPFVLRESPFRVLIELVNGEEKKRCGGVGCGGDKVVLVEVDAILFEHMLWLMSNDCSSLFKLNLKEILDFYAMES